MAKVLTNDIIQQIKEMIISGKWKIGERIPNESQLSEQYQVSRNTVREAIKALVALNVLVIKRGKGTFVSNMPGISRDPFGLSFVNPAINCAHLLEVRKVIEPEIAAMAAVRATADDIMAMMRVVDKMDALDAEIATIGVLDIKNAEQSARLDIEFHNVLCRMTHNPVFNRIMPIINQAIQMIFTDGDFWNYLETSPHNSHHDILKAIIEHDAATAKKETSKHISIYENILTTCGYSTAV